MSIKAVIFDLDGTLVESAMDMYMALNLTLTEVAFPVVSHAQVESWVGNGIEMLVKRGLSGDVEVNPELSESLISDAEARFKQHYAELVGEYAVLYPHVEIGLAALAHLPKALVTNKGRVFTDKLLEKLHLRSYFDVVVCGDEVEKKPSPAPLLRACELLQVEPAEAYMVGDSKSDLIAAERAGVPAIALSYGYHQGYNLAEFNPKYLFAGFLDIIPVLTQR
ncbi:HAD-IA family hydrolase [Pseudoalteromonas fenneropenaei]|uniref:phosphoglycolate phosphatase n=1 Tax=Pseudoalteromonas fenneropenaei TaxID=1737459 RepID=A0ABV7CN70_9GAMM